MSSRKQRKEIDKTIRNLINYVEKQAEWQKRLDELFHQMLSAAANSLPIDADELATELQENGYWHMVFGYVFEDFASARWDGEQNSFIDDYLKRRGWREAPVARRYLQALNDAEVQLWEITSVKPGYYAEVRPYGTDKQPVRVVEKAATQSLQQWDCLAVRVVRLNNTPLFTGALLTLPPSAAERVQRILDKIKDENLELTYQLLKDGEIDALPDDMEQQAEEETRSHLPEVLFRVWAVCFYHAIGNAMPTLQNQDGEALQLTTVRFPLIGAADTVTNILDQLPELDRNEGETTWAWLPHASDDLKEDQPVSILGHLVLRAKALELEVNSVERAERGTQWLAEQLGDSVGQPLTVHENLADKMANAEPMDDNRDLSQTEAGQALIKQHMDQHYRQTLDEPIPMLSDKTPRECAADPALHKAVVQWLKYIENQSAHAPSPGYDFSWIWEELGLERDPV